jgi:hypothetical protein
VNQIVRRSARFPVSGVLIFIRLWAKTPWPHQIAAPFAPSMSVRAQP